jgi:hypothetical protein
LFRAVRFIGGSKVNRGNLREWATPLAIGSFIISAVTGVLIFFHLNIGGVKTAHTWFSWLLVAGVAAHVITYRKQFSGYFQKPLGMTIITGSLILTLAAFLPLGPDRAKPPFMTISSTLSGMPFTDIAQALKEHPIELMEELEARNIVVKDGRQTIAEIARLNNRKDMDVLATIFNIHEKNGRTAP